MRTSCRTRTSRPAAPSAPAASCEEAPTTAAQAARIILDGVKAERWRILVGEDAHKLDERVRQNPEAAYTAEFYQSFSEEVGWRLG